MERFKTPSLHPAFSVCLFCMLLFREILCADFCLSGTCPVQKGWNLTVSSSGVCPRCFRRGPAPCVVASRNKLGKQNLIYIFFSSFSIVISFSFLGVGFLNLCSDLTFSLRIYDVCMYNCHSCDVFCFVYKCVSVYFCFFIVTGGVKLC